MATIIVGTNSYVAEEELVSYANDRGVSISGDTSILLIKAMDYIETRPYGGHKYDEDQALEFPRYPYVRDINPDPSVVPDDIKTAQIVAALLTDSGVNLLATVDRATKKEKVDVLEVEYMDNASDSPRYIQLNSLLYPFYSSGGAGGFPVIRG